VNERLRDVVTRLTGLAERLEAQSAASGTLLAAIDRQMEDLAATRAAVQRWAGTITRGLDDWRRLKRELITEMGRDDSNWWKT
jgi:hypothetical protein